MDKHHRSILKMNHGNHGVRTDSHTMVATWKSERDYRCVNESEWRVFASLANILLPILRGSTRTQQNRVRIAPHDSSVWTNNMVPQFL